MVNVYHLIFYKNKKKRKVIGNVCMSIKYKTIQHT